MNFTCQMQLAFDNAMLAQDTARMELANALVRARALLEQSNPSKKEINAARLDAALNWTRAMGRRDVYAARAWRDIGKLLKEL